MNKYRQIIRKKEVLPYFIVSIIFLIFIFVGALISYLSYDSGCDGASDHFSMGEENNSSTSLSEGLCMPRERYSILSYAITPKSTDYHSESKTLNIFLSIFNYSLFFDWFIMFFSLAFGITKLIYVANKTPKY